MVVVSSSDWFGVVDVVRGIVPSDADIVSVAVFDEGAKRVVRVETSTPGLVIGRRGAAVDGLRAVLGSGYFVRVEPAGDHGDGADGDASSDPEPRGPGPIASPTSGAASPTTDG